MNFPGSAIYWEHRYQSGGNSGAGSYHRLAQFKANVINDFIRQNKIERVVELGCGDGNQLSLLQCQEYIGLDISPTAIQICKNRFASEGDKSFFLFNPLYFVDNHHIFIADLALSIDVIYHLVEDDMYNAYMYTLFSCARDYVIIYSSNQNREINYHVRERKFTDWIESYATDWQLVKKIANQYPYDPLDPFNTSISDFYIYRRNTQEKN